MAVNTVKWLLRVAPHYLLEVLSSCCRKYNTNISPALAIQTARTSCQHRVEYLRLFTPTFTFHAPAPPASPPTSTDNERQRGSSGSSIAIFFFFFFFLFKFMYNLSSKDNKHLFTYFR
jgi:hypothetical protein